MDLLKLISVFILVCVVNADEIERISDKEVDQVSDELERMAKDESTMAHTFDTDEIVKRNAIDIKSGNYKIWPKGVVPYDFDASIAEDVRRTIRKVAKVLSEQTCVKYRPKKAGEYFVEFFQGVGCYANVGYAGPGGGKQRISIGPKCHQFGVILHEMMHNIGFWHEQSRRDRNQYVRILYDNIKNGKEHNFDEAKQDAVNNMDTAYDFTGIMHYAKNYFSKNGKDTIQVLDPNYKGKLGTQGELTTLDREQTDILYSCIISTGDGYTPWSNWGACNMAHCYHERERYCGLAPFTKCKDENRNQMEYTRCENCKVDGGWGLWTEYALIQSSWKSKRTRKCDNPEKHGAASIDCIGSGEQIECRDLETFCAQAKWQTRANNGDCGIWNYGNLPVFPQCPRSCTQSADCKVDSCVDSKPSQCQSWKAQGFCGRGSTMKGTVQLLDDYCKKSCNKCTPGQGEITPTHGKWGQWTNSGACTNLCDGGKQTRKRECNNPPSKNGGRGCIGASTDTIDCNTQSCQTGPVNGGWSAWSVGSCSKECGGGKQTRSRSCTNPSAQNGGQPCSGATTEEVDCNTQTCPAVNGGWSAWSVGSCSKECGGGKQTKSRSCTNPSAQNGGQPCSGATTEEVDCNTQTCPAEQQKVQILDPCVDSSPSQCQSWKEEGYCGKGYTIKGAGKLLDDFCKKSCKKCTPGGDGNTKVDGKWSSWSSWAKIPNTDNMWNSKRTRICTNPAPSGVGAKDCEGNAEEIACVDLQWWCAQPEYQKRAANKKCKISIVNGAKMYPQCPKSCTQSDVCFEYVDPCVDSSPSQCPIWKAQSICGKGYTIRGRAQSLDDYCKKSCNKCTPRGGGNTKGREDGSSSNIFSDQLVDKIISALTEDVMETGN